MSTPTNTTMNAIPPSRRRLILAITLLLLLLLFILIFFFVFRSSSKPSVSSPSPSALAAPTQKSRGDTCASLAATYDGKIARIESAQDIFGTVAIRVDRATCAYTITWHELFHSSLLTANQPNSTAPSTDYAYVADVVFPNESNHPLDGRIDPVYANENKLPPDAFALGYTFDFYAPPDIVSGATKHKTTTTFHHNFQQTGTFSAATINDILSVQEIRIYANPTNNTDDVRLPTPTVSFPVRISFS